MRKIIAIVGPTASGKTSLGKEIATHFNGEIISVDSRQIYKGMDIGTAKEQVDYGINLIEPNQEYSVAEYKKYTEEKIDEIFSRGKLPILVGGTGLWLQAVIDNLTLTEVPADSELRVKLDLSTAEELFDQYENMDPEGAELIDKNNKRRLIRAIEVTQKTGKPFSEQMKRGELKYDCLQIGLLVNRDELNNRINKRVHEMVKNGLINEVKTLKEKFGCEIPSMSGIGYGQICEFLDNKTTEQDAIEQIKKDTRAYAKRQMTWFKRDERIKWVKSKDEALKLAVSHIGVIDDAPIKKSRHRRN